MVLHKASHAQKTWLLLFLRPSIINRLCLKTPLSNQHFLLFGKETKGLPEDILKKYIEKTIRIPMRETLRSLNLSNSVAIVAYDVFRHCNFENLEETSSYFVS